jgi:hypothetical protein
LESQKASQITTWFRLYTNTNENYTFPEKCQNSKILTAILFKISKYIKYNAAQFKAGQSNKHALARFMAMLF